MKKTLITVLVVIVVILALVFAAAVGFLWYRNNHVFVENKAYPISAQSLDLREEDISFAHYDSLRAQLPNCEILWNVPFQNGKLSNDSTALSITQLTEKDIVILKTYFPRLAKVDASACQDYAILESLKAQLPEVEVVYTVSLGETSVAPDVAELVLAPGDYDLAALTENLPHLPNVAAITLTTTELTLEQIDGLKAAFPEIAVTYTVALLGQEYGADTTELDLSAMTSGDVETVGAKLAMLPGLTKVELTDSNGASQLAKEDVKALMAAAPGVAFHYTFDFYGETLSTDTEEVVLKNVKIGDEGETEVRLALDLLPNCKRFVLDNCKLSDEVMAQIREDYRDRTKVVWRVWFANGSTLTDVNVIRTTYDLVDDNSHDLIYCEDVRYMDIGHNEYLDGVDFVAGMPNLEVVIVSGAPIKDLTPFENCKKLKILEISNCGYIEDISPLAACESLEMVNLSFTKVADLSPLDELNITHLTAVVSKIPQTERDRFAGVHPDCWTTYAGDQPYGSGWRYDENNKPLPWYENIVEVFGYPHALNNAGWYWEEE